MVKLNKRGKAFFKKISDTGKSLSAKISEYEKNAPKRRQAEIKKLKMEIQIAKLKKQKKELQPKGEYYF